MRASNCTLVYTPALYAVEQTVVKLLQHNSNGA
jgi:hypothetical protein